MLEKIAKAPASKRAGSSNLTLISHIEVPEELVAQFSPQRSVEIDIRSWDAYDPDSGRRVLSVTAHCDEYHYHRGINFSWTNSSVFRQWTPITINYAPLEGEEEIHRVKMSQPLPRFENQGGALLPPVFDALVYLISAFVNRNMLREGDALEGIRDLSAEEVSSLTHWYVVYCDHADEKNDLRELALLWRSHIRRIQDGTLPSAVVFRRAGSGRVHMLYDLTPMHSGNGETALIGGAILEGGLYVPKAPIHALIERGSDAWHCAELMTKLHPSVIIGLRRTSDAEDTFSPLEPGVARDLVRFLGSETVQSGHAWLRLLAGYRSVNEVPAVMHEGFGTDWISNFINQMSWGGVPQQIHNALYYGHLIEVSAVDIEEFARTAVPANDLVESVTMLQNGKVRVVLRELVYPTMVQRRGHIYIEDEPGTVLSDMSVAAFDLDFRGTLTRFPDATAYADPECTRMARHTNITEAGGRVCLGDINTQMNSKEIELRGGVAIPCLADFLQMLRQCNLDSAYNRGKNFVLADPSSVTDEQWQARNWEIPGLRRVDVQYSNLINSEGNQS